MLVLVENDGVEVQPLTLDIQFSSSPPEFDRTGFTVDPLTCSASDATWFMPLPAVADEDTQIVWIEMIIVAEIFTYSAEDQTVYIADEIQSEIEAGLFCPEVTEISLEFLLSSDKRGEATETIKIPVGTSNGDITGASQDGQDGQVDGESASN